MVVTGMRVLREVFWEAWSPDFKCLYHASTSGEEEVGVCTDHTSVSKLRVGRLCSCFQGKI